MARMGTDKAKMGLADEGCSTALCNPSPALHLAHNQVDGARQRSFMAPRGAPFCPKGFSFVVRVRGRAKFVRLIDNKNVTNRY